MKTHIVPFYKVSDKLLVRSKDCLLFDSEGKQYIDFESGDWAAILGHSNCRITTIINQQAGLLMHDGLRFRNQPSEKLSERLLKILDFEGGKAVYLNSGSEAVNLAITLARNLTGREKILKLDCSFLSSFGFGQMSPVNTNLISIPMNNLNAIENIDLSHVAAFVFEPGNAHGLIKFPDHEFIVAIASKVQGNGGLLIANEVTTGMGRTGKWFGYQHYSYSPNIVAMGKGLGNGYPVSCVAIDKNVSDMFDKAPFRYAQSHQNDPLGCAVGMEVLAVMEDEELVRRSEEIGLFFLEKLSLLRKKYPEIFMDVRGRGLMLAMEMNSVLDAESIYSQLIEKGYLVGQKEKVLRFMPP
ncbi:MAG: aminotransferase class III-fold pyridoxal phosphate-dependent enzyme, partial [Prolixibacteraceae bacterium]|nr:aminotransferase class III-fold pyridoxal phosphate-dependent enzyme [Prolixibacteraceae bacterium]